MVEHSKQVIPEYFATRRDLPSGNDAQMVAALQYYFWEWDKGEETHQWLSATSLENTWKHGTLGWSHPGMVRLRELAASRQASKHRH